jgi:hypothetical protein
MKKLLLLLSIILFGCDGYSYQSTLIIQRADQQSFCWRLHNINVAIKDNKICWGPPLEDMHSCIHGNWVSYQINNENEFDKLIKEHRIDPQSCIDIR